ncbi:gas vesicle protein GvpG [Streptomyces lichenis]|uniref:Gas vesicle protein GvpG n=1 Tax=Streptomyces lichenis TaxID=2306967 RepID=A0ABT0IE39_9ACTN|nr:gas vesicle protein GvpG [Streptomyces lichenis]MCK8679540.1 gas vesicle protein GvpG [Streptomyces lichenis]
MGVLTQLLTLPLAPVRGVGWVVRQVTDAAEREYYDPEPVLEGLRELERELADGLISPREFDRREDELLDRLEEIRRHQGAGPAPGGGPR